MKLVKWKIRELRDCVERGVKVWLYTIANDIYPPCWRFLSKSFHQKIRFKNRLKIKYVYWIHTRIQYYVSSGFTSKFACFYYSSGYSSRHFPNASYTSTKDDNRRKKKEQNWYKYKYINICVTIFLRFNLCTFILRMLFFFTFSNIFNSKHTIWYILVVRITHES